jgi:GNAT superfamily N-acetyltransferase
MGLADYLVFREAEADELNLVLDSWLNSYKKSDYAGVIPNHRYPAVMSEMVAGLLGRGAKLIVAVEPETGRIWGWVCFEEKAQESLGVVHFCYVKDPYRKEGLAKALLDKVPGDRFIVTHRTRQSRGLERYLNATFAPEVARRRAL